MPSSSAPTATRARPPRRPSLRVVKKDFAVDDCDGGGLQEVRHRKNTKMEEDAWTKDLEFIRAMIRYAIDDSVFDIATAKQHLITVDPQARFALGRSPRPRSSCELSKSRPAKIGQKTPIYWGLPSALLQREGLVRLAGVSPRSRAVMHLERLEISGFKSFSDRSELSFDRGVTAIVGPNGCGKSNVADALTWVLGEQSAKSLRGDKMEDVIFSGSDARKPTGAAEVRLRFGNVIVPPSLDREAGHEPSSLNGDGAHLAETNGHGLMTATLAPVTREVEVTRRLFRSGESEYLIDGQTVPPEGHPRAADGHRPGRQGLRHHRAGQDRHDPELAADRSPPADRGSRGHHEVQGAPPLGRVEARGGAAEPDASRRHRLRGRQAARRRSSGRPRRRGATRGCATRCGAGRRCCSRAAITRCPMPSKPRAAA